MRLKDKSSKQAMLLYSGYCAEFAGQEGFIGRDDEAIPHSTDHIRKNPTEVLKMYTMINLE